MNAGLEKEGMAPKAIARQSRAALSKPTYCSVSSICGSLQPGDAAKVDRTRLSGEDGIGSSLSAAAISLVTPATADAAEGSPGSAGQVNHDETQDMLPKRSGLKKLHHAKQFLGGSQQLNHFPFHCVVLFQFGISKMSCKLDAASGGRCSMQKF